MSQFEEVIKVYIATLETEIKNCYKSADEAICNSLCVAASICAVLLLPMILFSDKDKIKSLEAWFPLIVSRIPVGTIIPIAPGFTQRLEKRDKARHLEEQRIFLIRLIEKSSISQADQTQINSIMDLNLRTILAPYEYPRKNLKELTDSVELYERRSRKNVLLSSIIIPAILLISYSIIGVLLFKQLEAQKTALTSQIQEQKKLKGIN